ncbi:ATP-binding cassette domain-containing protein [Actinoplanes flavus]|uniref:ATP-binding cassette domain-containing protein n=1 Tax=Actinoplanes flavus TaxID=2820290 RepID=A0ABS3UMK1_9ACTN|nr:ATP-binding cassette domain-containing protein [Actinoplanes flavus]MBO3739986.1 ATP-binding cassette domain-containing protein [Actinoplanes flavus]
MRFDKVWFRYARRADWTLQDIDAAVEPGQTIVVLGRNGAGKSTLLQLAAGVLGPSRGVIRDRPAVVGWVPERFPAAQPFTTIGYLRSMAEIRGLPAAGADRWLERLGLTGHAETPLPDLSKGTAQKVGLAQALLTTPGLLVLDEPWEGLDAPSRQLIPELVAEVTAAGGAVLVSDHRGEIANLPGAIHWTVTGHGLHHTGEPEPDTGADEVVVEVVARRQEAAATVDRLRASGHRVLGVRERDPAGVRETRPFPGQSAMGVPGIESTESEGR